MPRAIDISKTHGLCTARVIEQFGFPRNLRKFITDHVNWIVTKVYFDERPDIEKLRSAVSLIVKHSPFLRTRHIIDGDRDLLLFEDYDPKYDYLTKGTEMFNVQVQSTSLIIATSHVVTDLKSCHKIGVEIKDVYFGKSLDNDADHLLVYDEFVQMFSKQTDISRKPSTWRFLNLSVIKIEHCFTKEQFLLREMKSKRIQEMEFEEVCNTKKFFDVDVRGCTTIATLLHRIEYNEKHTDVSNVKTISHSMKRTSNLQSVNPDAFSSKYIYNFIRTDNIFNSVLTHLLMSSSELPPFIYDLFGLFVPMKNDTTEHIKIVFQNNVFGSIVINIMLH